MVTKVVCEPKHIHTLLIRILNQIIKELRQEVARIHAVSSVIDRNPTGALPSHGVQKRLSSSHSLFHMQRLFFKRQPKT